MDKIDTIIDTAVTWQHEDKENRTALILLINNQKTTFDGFVGGRKINMAYLLYSYMRNDENFVKAVKLALNHYNNNHGK